MKILHTIKKKLKGQFIKNFFTLLTGNSLSQIITFSALPILTRLYSEELFGILMVYSSTILLFKPVVSLSYELSIMLPKRDKDAINLLFINLYIITSFSILFFLIILFFRNNILSLLNINKLGNYIYLIPVSLFLINIITLLESWNNRNNAFKKITFGIVGKHSSMSASQISMGVSRLQKFGLIAGLILGQIINFAILLVTTMKSIFKLYHFVSLKRMLYLAKVFRDIPIFTTIVSFTNNLSNELPLLLISRYYGLEATGIYGLANKICRAPAGIVSGSISPVFFNEASKTINLNSNLYILVKKTYLHILYLAILIFSAVFIISFFLSDLLGGNWEEIGLYIRILLPWIFLGFLNSPISSLITVLNKQKIFVAYDIALLTFRFFAIYVSYRLFNDIIISIITFSIVGIIFNIIVLCYYIYIAKHFSLNKKKIYNR
jgi:O-antigen/teichoic acid export membrane protein